MFKLNFVFYHKRKPFKKLDISLKLIIGCPVKFSMAPQLYCHEKCGTNWLDIVPGCQQSDADAYCKLKFCP